MKKIIFDTDIGGDCDDAGALALLHECGRAGMSELLAVTISTMSPYAAGCADAINRWYEHEVPVGQTKTAPSGEDATFFENLTENTLRKRMKTPISEKTQKFPKTPCVF